jgi:heat shock protein 1/8
MVIAVIVCEFLQQSYVPRGVPQIEVSFDINANSILSVTTTDKGSRKKQDITITGASTLNTDDVSYFK